MKLIASDPANSFHSIDVIVHSKTKTKKHKHTNYEQWNRFVNTGPDCQA